MAQIGGNDALFETFWVGSGLTQYGEMVNQDEQQLIRQAQAGSTTAFEALVTLHAPMVYNLALRTLNDPQEAEDAAQETFVRAWQALPRFRADSRLSTWLYRITTNLCYNRLPHLKQALEAVDADETIEMADTWYGVETGLVAREWQAKVNTAVNQLPESYRLLITLRHIHEMSYQEIADVTGLPLGTVKTGIFRARAQIRQLLAVYEETIYG